MRVSVSILALCGNRHAATSLALWGRAWRLVLTCPALEPITWRLFGGDGGESEATTRAKGGGKADAGSRGGGSVRCGKAVVLGTDLTLTIADALATTRPPRSRRPWTCNICRLLRLIWCANACVKPSPTSSHI